jgi:hypothetical protein
MKFYDQRFEVYSSASDGATVAPVAVQGLCYPIEVNGTGVNVGFDARGIALNWRSICIVGSEDLGVLDSVVISANRVSLGEKKDKGHACNDANIIIR